MDSKFGLTEANVTELTLEHHTNRVHEAGHAVSAEHFGARVISCWSTTTPGGGHHGRTTIEEAFTADEHVLFAVAGNAAEYVWLEHIVRELRLKQWVAELPLRAMTASDQQRRDQHLHQSRFRDHDHAFYDACRFMRMKWHALITAAGQVTSKCGCVAAQNTTPSPVASSPQPATASATGGTAMSSVDELRGILHMAAERTNGLRAALAHIDQEADEIQGVLTSAVSASSQVTAQEAIAAFSRLQDQNREQLGLLNAASDAIEHTAAHL